MKNVIIAIIVLVLLAASYYVGIRFGVASAVSTETFNHAIITVHTLSALRDGDTAKAISLLEYDLDDSTYALGALINSSYTKTSRTGMREGLKQIAFYRRTNPRTPLAMMNVDSMSVTNSARENLLKRNEYNATRNAAIDRILREAIPSPHKTER